MKEKIQGLQDEIESIRATNTLSVLSETAYDDKHIMCLRAKLQVINELILSYEKQGRKQEENQ